MDARTRIEAELSYARAAREHGKEGRARVCARRAAGWAVAARYPGIARHGALGLLRWLQVSGPEELREAAQRLVVSVDLDHQLPHEQDPLLDAEQIVNTLIGSRAAGSGRGEPA
jgi:hypothetical protein